MIIKFCGDVGQEIVINEFRKIIKNEDDFILLEIQNTKEIIVTSNVLFSDSEPSVGYSSLLEILGDNITCQNSNIKIIKYPNNYYKIFVKKLYLEKNISENIVLDTKLKDCEIKLYASYPQRLKIVKNGKANDIFLKNYIKNVNIKEFHNNILLNGTTKNQIEYCLICKSDGEKLLECEANKIEINENTITTLINLNDVSNHGYVCVYKIEKNNIELEKSYTVYLNNQAKSPACDCAIIWAYVEALNIGNLKLARSLLSDELNEMLSDENMLEYFGNYVEIDTNWITENQNIIWVIRNNGEANGFIFEINNQKIQNIDTI